MGSTRVWASQLYTEFDLVHRLDTLPSLHADACGLCGVAAICLHVSLPSASKYGGQYCPEVATEVIICGRRCSVSPYTTVMSQISSMCETFFSGHWPCQTQLDTLSFLPELYMHVQARISLLGMFCVVCNCPRRYIGLKPLPCHSEACKLAFDRYGCGADLRDIYSRPVIADLLISMASSACQCTNRRDSMFKNMPKYLICKGQSSAEYAERNQQIDWYGVQEATQGIPSVAAMGREPNLQDFFVSMYPQTGMSKFRMLRWVLNSCKGHLMQLQGAQMFPMMVTEFQFRLCTDSHFKEAEFSDRKEEHGSQFLLHGSPFHNWHCILREGLKNMSGTKLMSSGDSYGPGIYLAGNSKMSSGHCTNTYSSAAPAYSDSRFGANPWCIALCEVINNSFNSQTTSIHNEIEIGAVPDAANVITRYLFVYPNNDRSVGPAIPDVQAKTLTDICDYHTKTHAAVLDAVRKAVRSL